MSIIPGIETAAPERTETSSGSSRVAEALAASAPRARATCSATSSSRPVRHLLAARHVGAAGVGRDREAGRDRARRAASSRRGRRPCRRAARARRRTARRSRRRTASGARSFHTGAAILARMAERTIVAMGGGAPGRRLDDLVARAARGRRHAVLCVGTAGAADPGAASSHPTTGFRGRAELRTRRVLPVAAAPTCASSCSRRT